MAPLAGNRALRFAHRTQELLDDPECTGNVLLLLLAMWSSWETGERDWTYVHRVLGWTGSDIAVTIRSDIPRYLPDRSTENICRSPAMHRDGPCGKPAVHDRFTFRDTDTGQATIRGACSRHWPDLRTQWRENKAAWEASEKPTPLPNSGGVMARHWPNDAAWLKTYKGLGARDLGDTLPTRAPDTVPLLHVITGVEEPESDTDTSTVPSPHLTLLSTERKPRP